MKNLTALEDVSPDPQNANAGTLRGQQLLESSLEQHGAARSIVVDADGVVLAGNRTLEAAVDHGLSAIFVPSDGQTLVVVQRTDLDLSDAKTRELAYLDNRTAQLGLKWDPEQLERDLISGVELGSMFTESERDSLLLALMQQEVKTTLRFENDEQYAQFLKLVDHVSATYPGSTFGEKFTAWIDVQLRAVDPEYHPERGAEGVA